MHLFSTYFVKTDIKANIMTVQRKLFFFFLYSFSFSLTFITIQGRLVVVVACREYSTMHYYWASSSKSLQSIRGKKTKVVRTH